MTISDPANLLSAGFEILPKPQSQTRAIAATYSIKYLRLARYFQAHSAKLKLPVFGLYQDFQNTVSVTLKFRHGITQQSTVNITTPAFDGGTYTNPTIVQPRVRDTTISYDFILLKGFATDDTPIIIDSDGEVRWTGMAHRGGKQALLFRNGIYVSAATSLVRLEFDGRSQTLMDYSDIGVVGFNHNFDYGRDGIVMDVDMSDLPEAVNIEVDGDGKVLHTWNLQDIITDAMIAGGDDPSDFVFPGRIWFHNNATAYRPSDDSLIVSSRENFVIALDHDSNAIKWILGDPTKHWHDYPSLRAFALTLGPDTLPPIGQHAVSIVADQLLLFDDGQQSAIEVPAGEQRTYSAPRKYAIAGGTATEVWHYLANPPIFSPLCSSVYEDAPDNYLIDYTLAGPYVSTDIVGLDANGSIAFYYSYEELNKCGTALYANPIHLENLLFN